MLVVKDQKYADLIPLLRHNGHCAFNFERKYYWQPAMGNVDLPELNGKYLMPGNYCLGEVECALGIELLSRIDEINARKRERAIYFIDELKDYPLLQFHRVDDRKHNYHLLVAEVANNKRDEFIRKMAFEKSIQCIVQYYPLNRYDFYKKLGFGEANCPAADAFFDNMVSFPFHHSLSDDDFEYMLKATKDVIEDIIV
jgi:dTDP-4-amino-4,6-dideoxygalactose transaminase